MHVCAKACGFTGLALTADFSWVGNRERETRTGFTVPPSYSMRQCIDAVCSPAWTFDYASRVPYGYKAVPDADFPAEVRSGALVPTCTRRALLCTPF